MKNRSIQFEGDIVLGSLCSCCNFSCLWNVNPLFHFHLLSLPVYGCVIAYYLFCLLLFYMYIFVFCLDNSPFLFSLSYFTQYVMLGISYLHHTFLLNKLI